MSSKTVEQIRHIMEPESLAVIGASEDLSNFGGWAMYRPMTTGFRGPIYPVNPKREKIFGIKCYKSVLDIPGDIDLAVIVIRAQFVPQVMRECVQKGVKGAIIMSSGFAEVGEEGRKLQDETVKIAEEGGIKFVGPNCLGVVSASAHLNFFFTQMPRSGTISFVSQSGTLGIYLVNMAASKGYGFNKFISVGNSASLTVSDYLEYLGEDPATKVIVMYLEGVRDGRHFIEAAKEALKKKPIVVYKGGRTAAGSRAAMSHTASLSGADEVFDAVCKQVGIIRCLECFHPFELAEALSGLPMARGKRVSIIGSGGRGNANSDGVRDEHIVAVCDVERDRLREARRKFPKANRYLDFRKLLDKEKTLDAVMVSTPDHCHAPASVRAMKQGLHCYCEKPLTHSVHEARVMTEVAQEKKLATHMGTPSRGEESTVRAVEIIRSGVIRLATAVVPKSERPAAWFSQNPVYEHSG